MREGKNDNAILIVNLSVTQRIELKCRKGEIKIGRSSHSDLILPDPSVSRTHARIVGTDYGFFLEDLSKNGTYINGKRIKKETLTINTDITIGPFLLRFCTSPVHVEQQDEVPTMIMDEKTTSQAERKIFNKKALSKIESDTIGIVGKSKEINMMFELMEKVAETDFPVLIMGETGTGKELVARGIHLMSSRRSHSFVALNCSAISPGLVESELFGHEKGAFTGAINDRKGAFEIAQGGTLFLDEIGEMSTDIQPKLLRVLEQSEIKRIGGNNTLNVNVRVIAATNRNLKEEIEGNKFRNDLYYRLNSFPIFVPPLRDRNGDIELLATHFLQQFVETYGIHKNISKKGMNVLTRYTWPGNVRELRNVINRAAIISSEEKIDQPMFEDLLSDEKRQCQEINQTTSTQGFLRKIDLAEKEAIVNELMRTKWNKTRAAKNLGISKSTLFDKLRRYSIKTPERQ